jgi:hypothetical protein
MSPIHHVETASQVNGRLKDDCVFLSGNLISVRNSYSPSQKNEEVKKGKRKSIDKTATGKKVCQKVKVQK